MLAAPGTSAPPGAREKTAERQIELIGSQIRLLEHFSPKFRERLSWARRTGALVAVEILLVGALRGVGQGLSVGRHRAFFPSKSTKPNQIRWIRQTPENP